ncbi:FG-GAP repeat domain-containing protein [Streptomyces gardneri]|uniref:FG-GAP repeat domain-containing protein n=1 Tax=Streptomyces gardneri TaxID=66892 RepID=UPI0036C0749D
MPQQIARMRSPGAASCHWPAVIGPPVIEHSAVSHLRGPTSTEDWGIYNKVTATGNVGGGPTGDLIARDSNGVDWLYRSEGDGTFATRPRVNSSWGHYTDLIPVGDADRDGRADLVVRHVTGGDTGSLSFHPRQRRPAGPLPRFGRDRRIAAVSQRRLPAVLTRYPTLAPQES